VVAAAAEVAGISFIATAFICGSMLARGGLRRYCTPLLLLLLLPLVLVLVLVLVVAAESPALAALPPSKLAATLLAIIVLGVGTGGKNTVRCSESYIIRKQQSRDSEYTVPNAGLSNKSHVYAPNNNKQQQDQENKFKRTFVTDIHKTH
jgi:hypothetical protein